MAETDIEFIKTNLERQLGWVRAAETRISLILPLATALFGSLAAKVNLSILLDCGKGIIISAALIMIVVSLLCASLAIFPRTKGPAHSMIFFGGIAANSKDEFISSMKGYDRDAIENDLLEQVHINACIASTKYKWIQRSMVCILISLIPWAISVSFLY